MTREEAEKELEAQRNHLHYLKEMLKKLESHGEPVTFAEQISRESQQHHIESVRQEIKELEDIINGQP
jgi:hypothetical protein